MRRPWWWRVPTMVDGDRGKWRSSARSRWTYMSRAIGRSLASPRLLPAMIIWILFFVFFVVAHPSYSSTPQQPEQKTGRQQEESGTNPQFLAALRAYKAQQYAVAQKQLQAMLQVAPASFEVNELLGLV